MDMEVTWVRVRVRYSNANYSKHITGLKMMDYCLSSYVQEFSLENILASCRSEAVDSI